MSDIYEGMVKHAYTLIEMVTKEYKNNKKIAFFPVLAGIGNCAIEYRGQGHNSYAVVDAINNYYSVDCDDDVKSGYTDGILTMIRLAKNIQSLQDTLDIIYYQCKIEKEGKAKVFLDIPLIIDSLNDSVKEKYEELKNLDDFYDWYKGQKEFAKLKYGLELY